jgi:hypothetical protein
MTGTPVIGRNARLIVSTGGAGVSVGYGKNISVKASAELIKEYSMDAVTPAIIAAGKQTYTWSIDRLNTVDNTWLAKLVAGTPFTLTFSPVGSPVSAPYITLTGCVVTNYENSASETGAVLQKVSGEATTMVSTDS